MNDRNQLREDRLQRVATFGRENQADFSPTSKAIAFFALNNQYLADLAKAKIGQVPGRALKATLLEALWLDFKDIARTSRSIGPALLGGSIEDYTMPPAFTEKDIYTKAGKLLALLEDNNAPVAEGGDTPEQKAAKAARRQHFLDWEIRADFVADLRADYDALIDANALNQAENQEGLENTAAIDRILLLAGANVENLDTLVQNKYRSQPEKLASWNAISRIHRTPAKKPIPTTPPTP